MHNDELPKSGEALSYPAFVKQTYQQIFHAPNSNEWRVEVHWCDAYFRASKIIIEGVVSRYYAPDIEGITGLYLFRHYLELSLKFIIFHARWLRDTQVNALDEEIKSVAMDHGLRSLWKTLQTDIGTRMPKSDWECYDTSFIAKCVEEFDVVDPPPGGTFRYPGKQIGILTGPAAEPTDFLKINYSALLTNMDHVHDVLEGIDRYLLETYGHNEEWQQILNSF